MFLTDVQQHITRRYSQQVRHDAVVMLNGHLHAPRPLLSHRVFSVYYYVFCCFTFELLIDVTTQ